MKNFWVYLFFVLLSTNPSFGAEDGMPQLDPKFWLSQIFWLIITFGILYLVLSKVVLPKISDNLETRKSQVLENLELAEKQRNESDQKLKDYEKVEKLSGISYELTTRLKYQIQSVDGNKDQKFIDNFVDNEFLALDTRAYRKYMSEITPDIDMTFEYTSQKGNKHTLDIPLGIDFFWPAAE